MTVLEAEDLHGILLADCLPIIQHYEELYADKINVNEELRRGLVSFQSSKKAPFDRWYKYREGYSTDIVSYYLKKYNITDGVIFDPFLGSGTTGIAALNLGLDFYGIELLPIGQLVSEVRLSNQNSFLEFASSLRRASIDKPWEDAKPTRLNEINISRMAYPEKTKASLEKYLGFLQNLDESIKKFYLLALLSVLEDVSYTRKDGQFLRWDSRSGKTRGKFRKPLIKEFDTAITGKISEMLEDLTLRTLFEDEFNIVGYNSKNINVIKGSSIEILPTMENEFFDVVFTSPPYANRYDYTRTYALELALMGASEEDIKKLRQDMLSCTVENRNKQLEILYPDTSYIYKWIRENSLYKSIFIALEKLKKNGYLNNENVVNMLENYISEMAHIIYYGHKSMKCGGYLFMINDNVKYGGLTIPIDLILSEIASEIGFEIVAIDILPTTKGNSSQQMGRHGQERLRKSVYIWRKR